MLGALRWTLLLPGSPARPEALGHSLWRQAVRPGTWGLRGQNCVVCPVQHSHSGVCYPGSRALNTPRHF